MSAHLQTAIIGPTGYTGLELIKILSRHPQVKPPLLFAREKTETAELFSWDRVQAAGVELLFLAVPHEFARDFVPEAMSHGMRVVDLSGAWRLRSEDNRSVYGFQNNTTTTLDEQAVYGLSELNRAAIAKARLVANPGCYPTTIILALTPFVQAGVIDKTHGVICDSKSGASGAGKALTPQAHFMEVANNFRAYNPVAHRHRGEILEQLQLTAEQLVFTPHLLPIPRGMLSTIYLQLNQAMTPAQVETMLREFYAHAPFVRICPPTRLPEIATSLHSNYCDIGFAMSPNGRRLTLFSAIDNLVKGASGQAVQNMNLMYGWDETAGLL